MYFIPTICAYSVLKCESKFMIFREKHSYQRYSRKKSNSIITNNFRFLHTVLVLEDLHSRKLDRNLSMQVLRVVAL